jgi:predicted amidohydrolase YtcJ
VKVDIAPTNQRRIMVLYDGTLIDGTGAKPKPHTVIILNEGKISSIVEKNQYQIQANSDKQIINLTARYIIPGLFDMHAHVASVKASSYNQTKSINLL